METIQIVLLALLQGLTEFLPISSSAHLILLPQLVNWSDQGLAFDVAVHLGTLIAVVGYFRHTLWQLSGDWLSSLQQRRTVGDSRLAWAVLLGTIPVGLAGLLLKDVVETTLRSPQVIAWATIGFGLLLGWADWRQRRPAPTSAPTTPPAPTTPSGHTPDPLATMRWRDVALIGMAQAIALIPGTSRSGITMTAGLALGLGRQGAARFSFLLSIPVILLAGALSTRDLLTSATPVAWSALLLGTLIAAISAYLCIALFLRLLDRIGMLPFVIYRLALGGLLLWWFS